MSLVTPELNDNTAMVALEMSLSFQEMEPIYNNDMSHDDDSIGY